MLKFSAWLACVTGIILAIAATAFHWGAGVTGPDKDTLFLLVSYFPAAVIFAGGFATIRGASRGPLVLMVAWGFMVGLGCMVAICALSGGADRPVGLAGMIMGISAVGLSFANAGEMRGES